MNEARKKKLAEARFLYETGYMDKWQYDQIKREVEANDEWVGPVLFIMAVVYLAFKFS